jgi:NAD+ synthase
MGSVNPSTAAVIIDVQPAFMSSLTPPPKQIIPATNVVLTHALQLGYPVIAICTEHAPDGSTWTLNMREDRQGFAYPDSPDSWLHPGLSLPVGAICLTKTRDSGFFRTGLDDVLSHLRITSILLAGSAAELCIEHTGRDAYARDIRVTYVKDAISGRSIQSRDRTLTKMAESFRQPNIQSEEIPKEAEGRRCVEVSRR